ncbi:hypothetical protein [Butyricicoccus sp.]|jgi:hypothetical protein|uniref:hypothetical protein n=1 Tax=Butyricicoccus sp. TaxID=2049021 RepID=UPI003AAF4582
MASNKLLQDTATLFVPLGENDDGIMQYGAYLLEKVFCRVSTGTNMSKGSLSAGDTLTLFIFDGKSIMTQDGAAKTVATACERIFYVTRGDTTPIDISEKLYIVPYDATSLSKPPSGSRRVAKVYRRKAGSNRMWHWEVHAQ